MRTMTFLAGALLFGTAAVSAAQEVERIDFAGGAFTVTEQDDATKVLAFDGVELARNYFVFFDGTAEVDGAEVALFEVGDGGNACGPDTLIAWKPDGRELETVRVGEGCNAPSASIGPYAIHFVPYLLPGESEPLQMWSPESGLRLAGTLTFAPQPGTGWRDLAMPEHMMDVFANEAVHDISRDMLGEQLSGVARGLSVGGAPETLGQAGFWSRGCVPHSCGLSDSFMAVDTARHRVYFAQQQEGDEPRTWPGLDLWPQEVRDVMTGAIGR